MNNPLVFDDIKELISDQSINTDRHQLQCTFVCPVTKRRVLASGSLRHSDDFGDALIDSAARSFWYEARRRVFDAVCTMVPAGFVRDVVEGAAGRMLYRGDDGVYTPKEVRAATVEAFLSVRHEFTLDQGRWVAREVGEEFSGDFERQYRSAPVETTYEEGMLARIFLSLASEDGLESTEREFLQKHGTLAEQPTTGVRAFPSPVELSEVRPDVRPTIYMLSWALCLVDHQLAPAEVELLTNLRSGLEIETTEAERMEHAARCFIIEQGACSGPSLSSDEQKQIGRRIGLRSDEVERVLVRRSKRQTA